MKRFLTGTLAVTLLVLGGWLLPKQVSLNTQKQKNTPKKENTAKQQGRSPRPAISGSPRWAKPTAKGQEEQLKLDSPANLQNPPGPNGEIVGIPWTAPTKGEQETMADMMARQAKQGFVVKPRPQRREMETERSPNLPDSPGAPAVSQWPPPGKDGTKNQGAAFTVQPLAPQTLGTGFNGATGPAETGAFPPDTMGTVGPTQYIVCLNGRIRSFNKTTGAADGVMDLNSDTFFAGQLTPAGSGEVTFTTDPRIRFDRLSDRWFILFIDATVNTTTGATTKANRALLAVSNTSTITGATVWTKFFFQVDGTNFADYETLGIDADAMYMGTNMFTLAGSYVGTNGYVIRKSTALSGGPLVVTAFTGLVATSTGAGPYTPQGVDNYDPTNTGPSALGYFIGVDNAVFSQLDIRRVSNPGGTPTISADITLTVPTTRGPRTVPHSGNTGGANGNLDGLDDRLFAAHLRNGRLWTAHNLNVTTAGVASGTARANGVRWYELQNLSTTPTLVQSGTVYDNTATNPRNYWIPSIMVSGQGHVAMGCSIAGLSTVGGVTDFANAFSTGRLSGDGMGNMRDGPGRPITSPPMLTASTTAYNPPGDSGPPRRWGDYSYTSLDPCDDMTMWTIQEYCNGTNTYGVHVRRLIAPAPVTPTAATPSCVSLNTTVNVTITGASVSGTGFYQTPATGISACRQVLQAAVNGGGVTVNSVTFNSTTSITLNITIAAGATTGARTITVTNPDGQNVTSAGILTINGTTATAGANNPVPLGGTLNLTSTPGPAGFTYSWTGPNGFTSTAQNPTRAGITVNDSGTYNVTVTETATGCVATASVSVTTLVNAGANVNATGTNYAGGTPPSNPVDASYGTFGISCNVVNTSGTNSLRAPLFFQVTQFTKQPPPGGPDPKPYWLDSRDAGEAQFPVVGDKQTIPAGMLPIAPGNTLTLPANFFRVAVHTSGRSLFSLYADLFGSINTSPTPNKLGTFKFTGVVDGTRSFVTIEPVGATAGVQVVPNAVGTPVFGTPGTQAGSVLAIDPNAPLRIAVAATDYATGNVVLKTSENGGQSWLEQRPVKLVNGVSYQTASHPTLAYTENGTLVLSYVLLNATDNAGALVTCTRLPDRLTIGVPVAVATTTSTSQAALLRPQLASGGGRTVLVWENQNDGAQATSINLFETSARRIVTVAQGQISQPTVTVSTEGHVTVGWNDRSAQTLKCATSEDGVSFGTPTVISPVAIGFGAKVPALADTVATPNLSLKADLTKAGLIHAVFTDQGNGLDVWYASSNDDGRTWATRRLVNDDTTGGDQFSPALAVDRSGGVLVCFYDTRLDSTRQTVNLYLARSSNGSTSFAGNERVTDGASNTSLSNLTRSAMVNLGDRLGIVSQGKGGSVLVTWTDTRLGSEDILFWTVKAR